MFNYSLTKTQKEYKNSYFPFLIIFSGVTSMNKNTLTSLDKKKEASAVHFIFKHQKLESDATLSVKGSHQKPEFNAQECLTASRKDYDAQI